MRRAFLLCPFVVVLLLGLISCQAQFTDQNGPERVNSVTLTLDQAEQTANISDTQPSPVIFTGKVRVDAGIQVRPIQVMLNPEAEGSSVSINPQEMTFSGSGVQEQTFSVAVVPPPEANGSIQLIVSGVYMERPGALMYTIPPVSGVILINSSLELDEVEVSPAGPDDGGGSSDLSLPRIPLPAPKFGFCLPVLGGLGLVILAATVFTLRFFSHKILGFLNIRFERGIYQDLER